MRWPSVSACTPAAWPAGFARPVSTAVRLSWQDLQLQQRCCLLESAVKTGKGQWLIRALVEFVGRCQLHPVVAAESKNIGKSTSCFHQPSDRSRAH
jgi:hypothetical protein